MGDNLLDLTPVVNIVSTLRVKSNYVRSYLSYIALLSEAKCKIGKIFIVCDQEPKNNSYLFKCTDEDERIELLVENESDEKVQLSSEKAKQWSCIANQGVQNSLKSYSDYTLYIEPDLCFPPDLLDILVSSNCDIVAPIPFLGGLFYDSWGFRDLNGSKISNISINHFPHSLIEVSSVGTCVLFKTEIFSQRNIRFKASLDDGLLVGVCNDARSLGYRVYANPNISVIHPTVNWRNQVWVIDEVEIHIDDKITTINQLYEIVVNVTVDNIRSAIHHLNLQNISGLDSLYFSFELNHKSRTIKLILANNSIKNEFKLHNVLVKI